MSVWLNGWQRLWVIVSVLYLVLVVCASIVFWPTAQTTWHRYDFIAEMPAELRARIDAAYESKWKWEEAWKGKSGLEKLDKDLLLTPFGTKPKLLPLAPGFILESEPVSFPNGAVLQIRVAKEGDAEHDARAATAYWAVVKAAARAARWTMAWKMALVWLIPCLTLYALGWAIAWVRLGFRSDDPRGPGK
jgi:hypothetical protein